MGMYTQVFIQAQFRNLDPVDLNALRTLFDPEYHNDGTHGDGGLPDHPFFAKERWRMVGNCSSHYFIPAAVSRMWWNDIAQSWCVVSCSDLKNYDGEIEAFFDWVLPLVEAHEDEFVGYKRYEETREPTLYYGRNG